MNVLGENEVLLSVIVPIYNAKETLNRCLNSILEEKRISLEVICVNDESTDDSLKKCYEYQKKDSRIKIVDKKNGGVASARNSGLEIAKGKYITFVDQDDWVEKNAYYEMLKKGISEDADMVVCNYTKDYDKDSCPMVNRGEIASSNSTIEELIRYAFFREEYRGYAAYVWNKLFKRETLKMNHIIFDGNLKRGDDVLFYTQVVLTKPKTVYIDKKLYHYVQRDDSITHTLTKENLSRLSEILVGYEKAIALLEEGGVKEEAISYLKCFYVYHASNLYELADKVGSDEEKEKFQKKMEKYYQEYIIQNKLYIDRIERLNKILNK